MAELYESIPLEQTLSTAQRAKEFTIGGWPEEKWWAIFKDPQLNELIEIAIQNQPSLKKAQAKMERAKQIAKKAKSTFFPTLNIDISEDWEYFSPHGFVRDFYPTIPGVPIPPKANILDLTLNFNYEFDFWGKNRHTFRYAIGIAKAKEAEKAQAKLILTTSVAYAYFTLQGHLATQDVLKKILSTRKEISDFYFQRSTYFIDNAIAPKNADIHVLDIQKALSNIEKEIIIDTVLLKTLMGKSPDEEIVFSYVPLTFNSPFSLPENISADLLARRPDLMTYIWQVEAAANAIGVAKADFYPNINLAAFAGLESLSFSNLFSWNSRTTGLAPALHLPIFTGGKLQANLSEKVADYNIAVNAYNEQLLQAAKEVVDEVASLHSLYEQIDIEQKEILSRQKIQELIKERVLHGIDNALPLLQAIESIDKERLNDIELKQKQHLSLVRLIKALGGGYHSSNIPPYKNKG